MIISFFFGRKTQKVQNDSAPSTSVNIRARRIQQEKGKKKMLKKIVFGFKMIHLPNGKKYKKKKILELKH